MYVCVSHDRNALKSKLHYFDFCKLVVQHVVQQIEASGVCATDAESLMLRRFFEVLAGKLTARPLLLRFYVYFMCAAIGVIINDDDDDDDMCYGCSSCQHHMC